jgi:hypothetical protein
MDFLGKVIRNRVRFLVFVPSEGVPTGGCNQLDAKYVKTQFTSPSEMSSARVF